MPRLSLTILATVCAVLSAQAQVPSPVVADSVTHLPLPNASVTDRHGKVIALSDKSGRLPYIPLDSYPVTIGYLGFKDKTRYLESPDTIFLQDYVSELPEVIVESRGKKLLHILAYVREYSTMTTLTDTVSLFREKMVDYMLPVEEKVKFRGWTTPRVLACRSYYRFTDEEGLDSVSDAGTHHFSWSDWVGIAPVTRMPEEVAGALYVTDTIKGRYSATETWTRTDDKVKVEVDVLADRASRRWVPDLSHFFRRELDFEFFKLRLDYKGIDSETVTPRDLAGYSFHIESKGRGHDMFRFNRKDEPFYVETDAEVYILDREYITLREARRWERFNPETNPVAIYEPLDAPALPPSTLALVERVNTLDKDSVRLGFTPDERLVSPYDNRRNFKIGQRALYMLKGLTGISRYKYNRNLKHQWNEFRLRQAARYTDKKDY